MARNGSGAMSIPNTLVSGATITAAGHNQNYSDIGSELTNSVALDGQSIMTGQFKAANGTVGAPSQTFGSDLDTGRYHKAADTIADACAGADVQVISTTGVAVTGTHSVSGTQSVTGLSSGLGHVPVGSVVDFAGTGTPSGWLLCYGQSLLRTDYPALFTAIGTTHGAADGTHFSLPDCQGRVSAGKDNMSGVSADRLTAFSGSLNGDTLGAVGGSETVTLDTTMIPAHLHGAGTLSVSAVPSVPPTGWGPTGGNIGTVTSGTLVCGSGNFENTESLESLRAASTTISGSAIAPSGSTANTGGGAAHVNVQPTIIFNKIIFAGV